MRHRRRHAALTYQPDPNYCNDPPGPPDTFTYTLNGGSTATVSVTVTCAPDDPVVGDLDGAHELHRERPGDADRLRRSPSPTPTPATTITGATVEITGDFAGAQDILALAGSHPAITPR